MPARASQRSWSGAAVASVLASGRRRSCGCGPRSGWGGGCRRRRRRTRLQRLLRRLLGRFGELHRPRRLLAGVDLEEAGTVVAAREAVVGALDGEYLIQRAHEGLARPLAAAVIIDRVDVIEPRDQRAAQQRLAAPRTQIPPAFSGPRIVFFIADRDTDPARGVVAEPKIRRRGIGLRHDGERTGNAGRNTK